MFKKKEKFYGFKLKTYWKIFAKEIKKDNDLILSTSLSFVIRDNKLSIDQEYHNEKDHVGQVYGIDLFLEDY